MTTTRTEKGLSRSQPLGVVSRRFRSSSKSLRTRSDNPPGCLLPQSARAGGSITDTCFVGSPGTGPGFDFVSM